MTTTKPNPFNAKLNATPYDKSLNALPYWLETSVWGENDDDMIAAALQAGAGINIITSDDDGAETLTRTTAFKKIPAGMDAGDRLLLVSGVADRIAGVRSGPDLSTIMAGGGSFARTKPPGAAPPVTGTITVWNGTAHPRNFTERHKVGAVEFSVTDLMAEHAGAQDMTSAAISDILETMLDKMSQSLTAGSGLNPASVIPELEKEMAGELRDLIPRNSIKFRIHDDIMALIRKHEGSERPAKQGGAEAP